MAQAAAAAQEHVQQFLDAANASRAAAEADVIELRQALAGRDETLAALQGQLDDARQQQQHVAAAAPGVGSNGGSSGMAALQQQVAALQEEVDSLRRELAAAHQRTHEVTQMYLSAASAATVAAPAAGGSNAVAAGSSRFLPPLPGMGRVSHQGVGKPKGLLGLYKRPQVRGLFVMYFVAVHAAVSAIVMRAS